MTLKMYSLARQFSRFPFGRFAKHGPHSGEKFREDVLIPAMNAGAPITIDLSGARGLGPSFLEEAFGGLVRTGFTPAQIRAVITVECEDDPSYVVEVWAYVDEAGARAAN